MIFINFFKWECPISQSVFKLNNSRYLEIRNKIYTNVLNLPYVKQYAKDYLNFDEYDNILKKNKIWQTYCCYINIKKSFSFCSCFFEQKRFQIVFLKASLSNNAKILKNSLNTTSIVSYSIYNPQSFVTLGVSYLFLF